MVDMRSRRGITADHVHRSTRLPNGVVASSHQKTIVDRASLLVCRTRGFHTVVDMRRMPTVVAGSHQRRTSDRARMATHPTSEVLASSSYVALVAGTNFRCFLHIFSSPTRWIGSPL